jgi:beta-glucosidase
LAEASSWDPQAVERSARISAIEATAAGLHWTFAPMVDIARDPRWGRIVEGSGEDPFLGSFMAAARVRGFQGEDLADANTMLACAKHFAAYGGAEGGRDYNTVDISERTLREIYLPPFHAAVKAGVATVMGAFNEIAGIPMHANGYLLNELLRGEWEFDGLVVSDYTAIMELQSHGVAATPTQAGMLAIQAGVDIDMMSAIYIHDLPEMVRTGKLPEAVVDQAVKRVLQAKYRAGLFDDPYRYSDPQREQTLMLNAEHLAAARDLARKSIVLLKNERQVLPLSKEIKTLAVIGPLADDKRAPLGSWAAAGRSEDVVTILQGIRSAVSSKTKVLYAKGCEVEESDRSGFQQAVDVAKMADTVILALGENADMSGEAASRSTLDLPGVQQELAEAIHATGTPVVVLLMNGRPLSITWLAEHIPALLETWFLGVQMGHAVADVLFGDYNPGGKLPVTFPRSVGQVPIYYNHKNTGRPPGENKFTSKYLDLPSSPLYPFGHGLSYSEFAYSNLQLSNATMEISDTLKILVEVTNVGSRAGDEVVQLYLRDEVGSVTRPVQQLRGFKRIHLSAGERKNLVFMLTAEDLAFYNQEMKWVVEPGSFEVLVGGNSVDVLEARFAVVE